MLDMGKEVGMRRWRYLIPLVALIVSLAVAYGMILAQRQAVRRMFDKAGREGQPILVVWDNRDIGDGPVVKIASLDGDLFEIPTGQMEVDIIPAFAQCGDLWIFGSGENTLSAWLV